MTGRKPPRDEDVHDAGGAPAGPALLSPGRGLRGRDPVLGPLLEGLSAPTAQARRQAAVELAAALGEGRVATEVLAAILGSLDTHGRWGAAWALWRHAGLAPVVLEVFVQALGGEDGDLRWAASSLLAREADRDDGLRRRLADLATGGTPRARAMAVACLGDLDPPTPEPTLLAALADEDRTVRLRAVTALSRRGAVAPAALASLASVAEADPDAGVRRAAAAVVARLEAASVGGHGQGPGPGGAGAD